MTSPRTSMRRIRTLATNDVRLLLGDPVPTLMLPVMAVGLMAFMQPAFASVIEQNFGQGFSGAEHAVPGMAVMFGFFLVSNGAFALFREHEWNTWMRIRVSEVTPFEVLAGKAFLPMAVSVVYFGIVFTIGFTVFHLELRGSFTNLALVIVGFSISLAALSLAMVSVARSVMQVNAIGSLSALVFAGLGGALTPTEVLPRWASTLGPLSPGYWAMEGFRASILVNDTSRAIECTLALLGFAALFTIVAAIRFRMDERKIYA